MDFSKWLCTRVNQSCKSYKDVQRFEQEFVSLGFHIIRRMVLQSKVLCCFWICVLYFIGLHIDVGHCRLALVGLSGEGAV